MKFKLISFGIAVILMSLVNIFGPENKKDKIIPKEHGDITFSNGYESVGFYFKEPNIFTYDVEPQKALSTIINTMANCYPASASLWIDEKYEVKYEPHWEPTPEPNNPLDFIPTWPEYIELEKDLYIDIPNRDGITAIKQHEFTKGTKVYFKEEE